MLSGPPQAKFFLSCGAERWGLPGVLPSDPFLFVCAEIILLFTSLLRLRHPQVHDLVEPALVRKSWLNEPRMLHYGPSEDTAK